MPDRSLSLKEILTRLYQKTAGAIRPGLEVETALLSALGNPQQGLPVIHVAGTNGKGSVCAMLEAVWRAMGIKTGLYTSPHLLAFNERFRINGDPVDDDTLLALVQEVEAASDQVAQEQGLRDATFFEISTAVAMLFFQRESVDLAIIETGMGGVWDATNVVSPLVSVITRISMDHINYLGSDLTSIAREKSGIIKSGRSVVCGPMSEDAREVVLAKAHEEGSPVVLAEDHVRIERVKHSLEGQRIRVETDQAAYGVLDLALPGRYQIENCAIVVATVETVASITGTMVTKEALKKGLGDVVWPGRCQVLMKDPPVLLDGAHNPSGARALVRVLQDELSGMRLGLVVSCLSDKDAVGFFKPFAPLNPVCWVTEMDDARAMSAEEITASAQAAGLDVQEVELGEAVQSAVKWAKEMHGCICITGSLHWVGDVLRRKHEVLL